MIYGVRLDSQVPSFLNCYYILTITVATQWRFHKPRFTFKIHRYFNLLYSLSKMVTPGGFEPPASRLGILRSIQLSYGTVTICEKQ